MADYGVISDVSTSLVTLLDHGVAQAAAGSPGQLR